MKIVLKFVLWGPIHSKSALIKGYGLLPSSLTFIWIQASQLFNILLAQYSWVLLFNIKFVPKGQINDILP